MEVWLQDKCSGCDSLTTCCQHGRLSTILHTNLFYAGTTVDGLYTLYYNSSWSACKFPGNPSFPRLSQHLATKPVTSGSLTSWNSSIPSVASAAQSDPNRLRAYYIGTDALIWELRMETNMTWSTNTGSPDQSSHWLTSDSMGLGGIAGLGWSD